MTNERGQARMATRAGRPVTPRKTASCQVNVGMRNATNACVKEGLPYALNVTSEPVAVRRSGYGRHGDSNIPHLAAL